MGVVYVHDILTQINKTFEQSYRCKFVTVPKPFLCDVVCTRKGITSTMARLYYRLPFSNGAAL